MKQKVKGLNMAERHYKKLAEVLLKAIEDYISDWALLVDGVVDYLLYPSTPQYN